MMETKITEAATRARKCLGRATSSDSPLNRSIAYLQAAEEAIDGIESEYDELMLQAKFCDLSDPTERKTLDTRIERYLSLDQLRHLLQEAKSGFSVCLNEIQYKLSHDAATKIADTQEKLESYLTSLDYDGFRSGLAVESLKEIQNEYLHNPNSFTNQGRNRLRKRIQEFNHREKVLLDYTSRIRDVIETLQLVTRPGNIANLPVQVFISHCHKDSDIARALVDLLEAAISIHHQEIRCTSLPGYKLRAGTQVPDQLREDLRKVQLVLGIVTENVLESPYVLFELGAAWGLGKSTFPLVKDTIGAEKILGPIAPLHRIELTSNAECHQLLDDIVECTSFNRTVENAARVEERVERLVCEVK